MIFVKLRRLPARDGWASIEEGAKSREAAQAVAERGVLHMSCRIAVKAWAQDWRASLQNVPEKRAVRSIMEEVQRASFDSAVPLLDRRLDLGAFHNQPSPVHCVLFSVELFEPGHGLLRGPWRWIRPDECSRLAAR